MSRIHYITRSEKARVMETQLTDGSHVYDVEALVESGSLDEAGQRYRVFAHAISERRAIECADMVEAARLIAYGRSAD